MLLQMFLQPGSHGTGFVPWAFPDATFQTHGNEELAVATTAEKRFLSRTPKRVAPAL
jgi:hypothetical protein